MTVHPEESLRPMVESDVATVMEIELRAYPHPWTDGIFRDCLRAGYIAWVAERGSRMVGYGVILTGAGETHILNLCVDPELQGHGIGRRLLDHLLRVAMRGGARTAFLEVRPSNRAALALYEAAGFGEIGYRKGYYPDGEGREDALVLALEL